MHFPTVEVAGTILLIVFVFGFLSIAAWAAKKKLGHGKTGPMLCPNIWGIEYTQKCLLFVQQVSRMERERETETDR